MVRRILRKKDILVILFLAFLTPLFYYKLGQSSLVSWDEAWYADIARNILLSGNWFQLNFNANPFFDHPPFGFWLIAISEKIFGFNELGARFAPALAGILSIFTLYFLGKELFNRYIGILAAVALPSATWFLYRARSGNLDTILTFLFLLTLFLILKSSKEKNYLNLLAISFSLLVLTKTVIPFTILPVLVLIFWGNKIYKIKDWIFPTLIFLVLFGGWYWTQYQIKSDFHKHYLHIGTPGITLETSYLENLKLMKDYLYAGIGKWFWPGVISLGLGLFLRQKRFYILAVFFLSFFIPFIFSAKGQIWHLIPLHPILVLSSVGFSYVFLEKLIRKKVLVFFVLGIEVFYLSFIQIKQSWYQFIDIPAFVSDEAILSKEAKNYPQDVLYIDGDFTPAAVFYSEKKVSQIWFDAIPGILSKGESILLITKQERLDGAEIPDDWYDIIKKDRDRILIKSKKDARIAFKFIKT